MDQLSFWTPVSYSKEEEPLTFSEQALQICDACFSIWTNQKGRVYSKQNGSLYQSVILEKQERSTLSTIIIVAAHFFLIPAAVAFIGKVILRHKYRFTIYEKNESITNAFNRTIALSNQKETALLSTNSAEEATSLRSPTTASEHIFDESENSLYDIPLCWKMIANHVYSEQTKTITEHVHLQLSETSFGIDNTNPENIITLIRLKSGTLEEKKYTIPKENINNTVLIQNFIQSSSEEAEDANIIKMSRSTFPNNNDAIFDIFFNTLTISPSELGNYFQYMNPSMLLLIYYGAFFYENRDIQDKIKKCLFDYSRLSALSIDESEILEKFWEKYTWNCIDNLGHILVRLLFTCALNPHPNTDTLRLTAIDNSDLDMKIVQYILEKTGKHIDVHGMVFTSKETINGFYQSGFQKISDFEPRKFFEILSKDHNFSWERFPKIIQSDSNRYEYIYQVFKQVNHPQFLQYMMPLHKEEVALEIIDLVLGLDRPLFHLQLLQHKAVRKKIIPHKNIVKILDISYYPYFENKEDFCDELYEHYKDTPNILIDIVKNTRALHDHKNTFVSLIQKDPYIIKYATITILYELIEQFKEIYVKEESKKNFLNCEINRVLNEQYFNDMDVNSFVWKNYTIYDITFLYSFDQFYIDKIKIDMEKIGVNKISQLQSENLLLNEIILKTKNISDLPKPLENSPKFLKKLFYADTNSIENWNNSTILDDEQVALDYFQKEIAKNNFFDVEQNQKAFQHQKVKDAWHTWYNYSTAKTV